MKTTKVFSHLTFVVYGIEILISSCVAMNCLDFTTLYTCMYAPYCKYFYRGVNVQYCDNGVLFTRYIRRYIFHIFNINCGAVQIINII